MRVIPNSSKERIETLGENVLKVYLMCVPEKGKANARLIAILSNYFSVSKSSVSILSGKRSGTKVVEI
ncbi:MAG: DUF167 domain-containing protein [Alphaproteobacteria bacterium]|nr:DUF167 domain-containing protein [Alphaproteobacteria bacterium]